MKFYNYILALFFLSSCSSVQNIYLINASHSVSIGGVKGARAEKFDIIIRENPKLKIKHLLVGNVIVELQKELINGKLHLKGQCFPEKPEALASWVTKNFNLKETYLISENIKEKKEISQKIIFSDNVQNTNSSPTEDVPE